MNKKSFTKRIMAFALSLIMVVGLMPLTAYADGEYTFPSQSQSGNNNSKLWYYLTDENAGEITITMQHDGDVDLTLNLDDGWYFEKWTTKFNGYEDIAGWTDPEVKGNNPVTDDGLYTFFNRGIEDEPYVNFPGTGTKSISILTGTGYYGDHTVTAVLKPIVTVNASVGVTPELTTNNPTKVSSNQTAVKYKDDVTITYTVDEKYVVTDVNASGTKTINIDEANNKVVLVGTEKPTSVGIHTRLKQQKVNFNANGGEGTMAAQTFEHSVAQALTENSFTKTGYVFNGWNTKADGSGAAYTNGASVTFAPENDSDNITLYAQWLKVADHVAPKGKDLVYDGTEQELLDPGYAENGTFLYSMEKDGEYTTEIPKAVEAGKYECFAYLKGNEGYSDSEKLSYTVNIEKRAPSADDFDFPAPNFVVYDNTAKEAKVDIKPEIKGMGNVQVLYSNAENPSEMTSAAPVQHGTYNVYAKIDDGENYKAVDCLFLYTFTISATVTNIENTDTNGFVDTYTVTYSDGTTTTFTVTNGAQGIQGIQGEPGKDGHTPIITIQNGNWYIDGVDTGVAATGIKGDTGNGISDISKTKTEGLVDTYTITYTDGTTTTFTVTNGEKGDKGDQGEQGIQGVPGKDGHTPVITIVDGYWHIDGVNTNILAVGANGEDGKDGVTPQLRINSDNIWEVSYDNGATWESLGISAVGQNGSNGTNGVTPKLRVNSKNVWEVSYDNGATWESLGISAVGTNGTNGTNGKDGKDGKDGVDGKDDITPKLRINEDNIWEVSYDNGQTWESLGVSASGADGVTPQLRINGDTNMWEVSYDNGETWSSMGVVATGADGKDGSSILPLIISCISLAGMVIMVCVMLADRKKKAYPGR